MSASSAGSHGDAIPLFSERWRMSLAAVEWCKEHDASPNSPVNIVTALLSLGLVVATPVLTDEEREAITSVTLFYRGSCDYYGANDEDKETLATLRRMLERT